MKFLGEVASFLYKRVEWTAVRSPSSPGHSRGHLKGSCIVSPDAHETRRGIYCLHSISSKLHCYKNSHLTFVPQLFCEVTLSDIQSTTVISQNRYIFAQRASVICRYAALLTCGTSFLLLFVFLISSILHHHPAILHRHAHILDHLQYSHIYLLTVSDRTRIMMNACNVFHRVAQNKPCCPNSVFLQQNT